MKNPERGNKLNAWRLFFIWCLALGVLPGCAGLRDAAKGFAGVSTRPLEESRKGALTAVCPMEYGSCFSKTLEVLKKNNAYIYEQSLKDRLIAFYVSEEDTTPVGVFFKETEGNATQVEVVSPSAFAKELFAQKLFDAFTNTIK